MILPKYLQNWPSEALWVVWLGALAGLATAVMFALGVDHAIIGASATFIVATGRLVTGALLPTPTRAEAVEAARANIPAPPR